MQLQYLSRYGSRAFSVGHTSAVRRLQPKPHPDRSCGRHHIQYSSGRSTRQRIADPTPESTIVLLAYSRGITSSREIAQACRENVLFMALSTDSQPPSNRKRRL